MRKTDLCQGWQFRIKDEGPGYYRPHHPDNLWRDATVPGHVHIDLVREGVIAEPFVGQSEWGCQWIDHADWSYRTTFEWTPDASLPCRKIVFEGLDTVCSVWLNGIQIADHDNMFVPLEIDVSSQLQPGENTLQVDFESAVRVGDERRTAYMQKEGLRHDTTFFDERAFVRKVQCMSGWDWGPRLVSCGIWQPVQLIEYASRIVDFRVRQERLDDGRYRVWTETEIEGSGTLSTQFQDEATTAGELDIIIDDPRLWWPNGYGDQPLYEVRASLSAGHSLRKKIGLRTIELRREPDAFGESFSFFVNGREIWARGANWIPNDAFPSQITDQNYRDQVRVCKDLNMNMLRVWGGGLYESDEFYNACDREGILVWQDFPFACSYYPDDEAAQGAMRVEATYQIKRLRDRTCLALWCGNNENEQMWAQRWGDGELIPPRYYGDVIYGKVLPELISELCPGTGYIPTSPTGSDPNREDGGPNDGGYGDQHYWDAWHGRGDWKYYAESTARFSSEFGFASSCSVEAWRIAGIEAAISRPSDPDVRWHDRTRKPWETFRGFVELHYPHAETLEDWIHTSQLNQRDALRFAIEYYRIHEFCKGTLIWQFNDCWPVQSWAVQDYARKLKPAGRELSRLYAPVLIAIQEIESKFGVYVVNDSFSVLQDQLTVDVLKLEDGATVHTETAEVLLHPGERRLFSSIEVSKWDSREIVLRASLKHSEALERWALCAEPKDALWPSGYELLTPESPAEYWL